MLKLDLEKAEEPEIKLPTSAGSSRKQESSRKTSISALLTMPTPLSVWITTNWKILKEMGMPDHLTCCLRNLNAGQEATVRTGEGNGNPLQCSCLENLVGCHLWGCTDQDTTVVTQQQQQRHTVKGFGVVNKAEMNVFLKLSCFFDDATDVGNFISGSSAFSKSSLNIWKFTVHILLKPGLESFEHYFTGM